MCFEILEDIVDRWYLFNWKLEGYVYRVVREMLFLELFMYEYVSYFKDKLLEELDVLVVSFKLENCVRRDGFNEILRKDVGMR